MSNLHDCSDACTNALHGIRQSLVVLMQTTRVSCFAEMFNWATERKEDNNKIAWQQVAAVLHRPVGSSWQIDHDKLMELGEQTVYVCWCRTDID
jgi:hypothetical protein